jgi:uracil-DNA glycosylase
MKTSDTVGCKNFPCIDVNHLSYIIPGVEVEAKRVSIVLISESAPEKLADYYYAAGNPIFAETTLMAFNEAGVRVSSIQELIQRGVYLTSAVKCAKTAYGIRFSTIAECSRLLESELSLFPNVKACLLMGNVAIKAINLIAKRSGEARPVPAGSTYKIRGNEFYFRGKRVFPSYLQAGASFFIEKSKRRMIAEDISSAWSLVQAVQ